MSNLDDILRKLRDLDDSLTDADRKMQTLGSSSKKIKSGDEVDELINDFEELADILPINSQGLTNVIEKLHAMRQSMEMTTQDAVDMKRSLSSVFNDLLKLYGGATDPSQLTDAFAQAGTAVNNAGMFINRYGGNAASFNVTPTWFLQGNTPPQGKYQEPSLVDIKGNVEKAVGNLKDLTLNKSEDEVDELFSTMREGLSDVITSTQLAGTVTGNLRYQYDALTNSVEVYYDTYSKVGNQIFRASGNKASFDAETGAMRPEHRTFSTKGSLDSMVTDAQKVQQLYSLIETKVRTVEQAVEQSLTDSTGTVNGEIEKAQVNIDEVTGKVQVLVNWMQKLSDSTSRTGQEIQEFSIEGLSTGAFSLSEAAPPDKLAGAAQLFDVGSQTTFLKNFNEALKDTSLSASQITSVTKDVASGITRISLASKNAEGATKTLSLAFNSQGKQVNDLSTRYSSLATAIQQNIARVFQYAVATTIVYGAMQKLQEIPPILAEIDAAMSRLSVLTTLSEQGVESYFNTAIDLAGKYGFALKDVLSASEQAVQATGGDADEAAVLLGDAMLYAKLSGEGLNESLDTLVASLSQLGLGLDQGKEVMSKWIVLSREFKVTVDDMAKVFASTGSLAAEMFAKDLSTATDELNAIIAVASKATSLSPSELGNFLKTVVTNVTSPSTVNQLKNYGIEVKTVTGEYRDFYEVLRDVYTYTVKFQGARSETALADISRVMGGGGSRQASRLAALIEQFGEIENAFLVSQAASEETLGNFDSFITELTDNLKGDVSKLSLEFSRLLKTLGDSGLSDGFSTVIKLLTSFTSAAESFISVTGDATAQTLLFIPAIYALNFAIKKLQASGGISGVFTGFGESLKTAREDFKWMSVGTQAAVTLGPAIINGIQTGLKTGDVGFGLGTAVVTAMGAGIGAALGGAPGAYIGATITSFFTNMAAGVKSDIEKIFIEFQEMGGDAALVSTPGITQDLLKGGDSEFNLWKTAIGMAGEDIEYGKTLANPNSLPSLGFGIGSSMQGAPEGMEAYFSSVYGEESAQKIIEYYKLLKNQVKEEDEALDQLIIQNNRERPVVEITAARQQALGQANLASPGYDLEVERLKRRAFTSLVSGEISPREYSDISSSIDTDATNAAIVTLDALGEAADSADTSFTDLLETFSFASDELSTYVAGQAEAVARLRTEVELGTASWESYISEQQDLLALIGMLNDSMKEQEDVFNIPSFIDVSDTSQEDFMADMDQYARPAQENYLTMIYHANEKELKEAGYDNAEAYIQGFLETIEDLPIMAQDKMFMLEGLLPMFVNWGRKAAEEASSAFEENFNIKRLKDLDPSKIPELQAANRYWVEYMANARGMSSQDYLSEYGEEQNLILGPNNVFYKMLSTQEAMNFVLQDILDTEKKQLEGMWNIPEGSTFWVPITSAFYQNGGGGGYPELPPLQEPVKKTATGELPEVDEKLVPGFDEPKDKSSMKDFTEMYEQLFKLPRELWHDREPLEPEDDMTFVEKLVAKLDAAFEMLGVERETPESAAEILGGKIQDFLSSLSTKPAEIRQSVSPETSSAPQSITVNVPEPQSIRVESNITATLQLNGKAIARYVKTVLSKEMNRKVQSKKYTTPVGKV